LSLNPSVWDGKGQKVGENGRGLELELLKVEVGDDIVGSVVLSTIDLFLTVW